MPEILQSLDAQLLLWIQDTVRQSVLDPLVCFYTALGNAGMLWIAISVLLLCYRPTRKAGAVSLLALAIGFLCTNVVLKHLVGRPRPWLDVAGLTALIDEHDPNSFPSGHTCAAFAAATVWFRAFERKWGAIALVMAAAMGFSRLYVGVHYPSDVLFGALVGAVSGAAAWKLTGQLEKGKLK